MYTIYTLPLGEDLLGVFIRSLLWWGRSRRRSGGSLRRRRSRGGRRGRWNIPSTLFYYLLVGRGRTVELKVRGGGFGLSARPCLGQFPWGSFNIWRTATIGVSAVWRRRTTSWAPCYINFLFRQMRVK